jgi:protein LSM14
MAMNAQEMPPSHQIFEMVVFKGSEIQELTVLQPPAPQQPAYAPPAPQQSPWGQPPQAAPAPPPPQQQQQQPQQAPAPSSRSSFGSNPWGQPPQAEQPPAPAQTSSSLPTPAPAPTVSVASVAPQEPPSKPKPLSYAHAAGGNNPTTRPSAPRGGGRGGHAAPRGGRGNGVHHHAGRGGGGRGGHQPTHAPPPPQPLTIPNEEFDFQQSLTKFDKDKVAAEAKGQIPAGDAVYNKDDFFDSLSCEALERQNNSANDRRNRMFQQRRTDAATFGYQGSSNRGRGGRTSTRGRGGGRGGRGRSDSHHTKAVAA